MDEYLQPKQYAKLWNVSYTFVIRCIHNGRLNAVQIGSHTYRIKADEPIKPKDEVINFKHSDKDYLKMLKSL